LIQTQPLSISAKAKLDIQTQLLNRVEEAVLVVDLTGRIVYWNQFAENLFGWTMEEIQGSSIVEVLAVPQLMELLHANMAQLDRGENWSDKFFVQRHNHTTFIARLNVSLIRSNGHHSLISIVVNSSVRTEHQQVQDADRLLAEAKALIMDASDYEAPLTALAQLAVPQLADWCAIHLLQTNGSIELAALVSANMEKRQGIHDWLKTHLPDDDTGGLSAVLHSGKSLLLTDAASDSRASAAEIKSYMIVPLIAFAKTLGAITFVAAESGRRFDRNALALAEKLASHIAIYLDKTHLYHESKRMNAELEQRVSERTVELSAALTQLKQSEATIQTLFRISNKLNATLDVDTILDELAQEAIRIVNGESGFAGLRTSDGMSVRKYFRHDMAIPFEYTWPPGRGIPGWVLKHKVPYGTSDAAHDPVMQHELVINADVRSIICTPILDSVGEVLGYFDIRNKRNGEGFTISDQEMLISIAPIASIAIQNALAYQQRLSAELELKESYERLRALTGNMEWVREEERTRIAREMHDQLGQALTAMKFDMVWLTDHLVQKDTALAQKAKTVTAQMDTMVKTVRRIATELRPGMLEDLGLAASIEWQARDFKKLTGILCTVSAPAEDLPPAPAQSLALFRIFQEALTNVARHAKAQHVEVNLSAPPEMLVLKIHDDGRGIKMQEIASQHSLGLLGMRERAQRLGGTFDIQGTPGAGTTLTVSIPIKKINNLAEKG
jgi:PAS domain S-box-containing protein